MLSCLFSLRGCVIPLKRHKQSQSVALLLRVELYSINSMREDLNLSRNRTKTGTRIYKHFGTSENALENKLRSHKHTHGQRRSKQQRQQRVAWYNHTKKIKALSSTKSCMVQSYQKDQSGSVNKQSSKYSHTRRTEALASRSSHRRHKTFARSKQH